MSARYDTIVIGGGHNGLVAAAYLGRAGRRTLVVERRPVVGGAAVSAEIHPGFTYSVCSYVVSLLRPEIIRDLDLASHGLELLPVDGTFTPLGTRPGDYLWRVDDAEQTRREIARHSTRDADGYADYGRTMSDMARFVAPLLTMAPRDPTVPDPRAWLQLWGEVQRFRMLGDTARTEFARLMTASAVDFLDRWFEGDALKATLAASGIIGTCLGVRSPGTAYVLLHHYMGEVDGAYRAWGLPRGGTGALSAALAGAARAAGVEIRTDAGVDHIVVEQGRATGVVLDDGESIAAATVASGVDPRRTFLGLVGPRHLPDEFRSALEGYRFRGSSGKVNLALDALPDFPCRPGAGTHLRGAISISPSVDYMERAYDDAKYGAYSRRPYLDVVIPSLSDPTVAPPGKHVMSCFVQYAPYSLADGDWDTTRDRFGDGVIDTLAEFAPNIRDIVLHRQVLTPLDLERQFGLTEGNIFHGELSRDQLFFLRPTPGWARYRTPIRGLYLCGSGAHPGGGLMGAPGLNAARAIIADRT